MWEGSQRRWRLMSIILAAVLLPVAAATIMDYGVTWDENYYKEYGVILLNWYSSLGANQEALSKWRLNDYGGLFDLVAELASRRLPFGVYESRHVVSTAFGLLGLAATYGIGHQIAGARGGFFAALFLALTPVYYGQMFTNAKDIPFAALFALSLFCLLRTLDSLPHVSKGRLLQLGIATGLAMAVRVPGIVLLGYVALLWGLCLLGRYWSGGTLLDRYCSPGAAGLGGLPRQVRDAGLRFAAVAVVAWATMVAFWPFAQVSPLLNPFVALKSNLAYDWPMTVLFEGRFLRASELPAHYLPTWFALTLPEFYFVALLAGAALGAAYLGRWARGRASFEGLLKIGLLVAVVCVPVGVQLVTHSTIYDGLRQFLFVLPALAALAGVSVAGLLGANLSVVPRLAVAAAVLVSVAVTVGDMVELHPYQYVYFNRLVAGGLESAGSRFETDYYGASYREGVLWLGENYRTDSKEKVRVGNPSNEFLTEYYLVSRPELRDRFQHVKAWDRPNVYLVITRWDWHKEKQGKLLHVVERKGVPLLYILELEPPGPEKVAGTAGS